MIKQETIEQLRIQMNINISTEPQFTKPSVELGNIEPLLFFETILA